MKKIVNLKYFLYICKVFIIAKQTYFNGKRKNHRKGIRGIWEEI